LCGSGSIVQQTRHRPERFVTTFSVGYFVGSLAKASINRKPPAMIGTSPGKIGAGMGTRHAVEPAY
jgi:hypothetical protein